MLQLALAPYQTTASRSVVDILKKREPVPAAYDEIVDRIIDCRSVLLGAELGLSSALNEMSYASRQEGELDKIQKEVIIMAFEILFAQVDTFVEELSMDELEPPFAIMYRQPFMFAQKLMARPDLIRDVPFKTDTDTLRKLLAAGEETSSLEELVESLQLVGMRTGFAYRPLLQKASGKHMLSVAATMLRTRNQDL